MKKAILFFGVLFTIVSLVSCTSDDFENQVKRTNKTYQNEENYSLYGKVSDTIITNSATEGTEIQGTNEGGPVITIKKD